MSKTVIGRHRVGDFNTWLKGHEDRKRIFAPAVSSFQTFQDAGDPNSIAIVFQVNDLEKLAAIINDPAIAELKKKHTVLDPVILSMQVDV